MCERDNGKWEAFKHEATRLAGRKAENRYGHIIFR
jgi:hypothetical protein